MPGEVSRVNQGPSNKSPYVATWMYDPGTCRICTCGCHEGFHGDNGAPCINARTRKCTGFKQDGDKVAP